MTFKNSAVRRGYKKVSVCRRMVEQTFLRTKRSAQSMSTSVKAQILSTCSVTACASSQSHRSATLLTWHWLPISQVVSSIAGARMFGATLLGSTCPQVSRSIPTASFTPSSVFTSSHTFSPLYHTHSIPHQKDLLHSSSCRNRLTGFAPFSRCTHVLQQQKI